MADQVNMLDLALMSGDDDLLLLHYLTMPQTTTFDASAARFDLNLYTDEQSKVMFRFSKDQIFRLVTALDIPPLYKCSERCVVSGLDGLCLLLRRLSYPNRFCDLEKTFGRPKSVLSRIVTTVLDDIYARFGSKFTHLEHHPWMDLDTLHHFADAIHDKGAPLLNCWGFIDGTPRPICRPTQHQKVCFSGHKRVHCLRFQSVVAPNGLIVHLYGPVEGRRHDSGMLRMSELLHDLERVDYRMNDEERTQMCLYGDPAYPMRNQLIAPYKGAILTDQQKEFNRRMSAVRECVEWQFGKIVQNFAFLDFKKNLKLYLQPVGKLYIVGALMTNCHTCINGSVTGAYFNVNPPALEDYLAFP